MLNFLSLLTTTTTFILYLKVTRKVLQIFVQVDTGKSEFSKLIESDYHYVTNYNLCQSHKGNDTHYVSITKQSHIYLNQCFQYHPNMHQGNYLNHYG